ncbi:L-type lectin-domain containing receptor kinase S.4-like [Punica granatum]|uniref:non-specific serine/threonine protein kinase n=2 Tax=Punica granatum TaxID=22663 RepID=A0A218XA17_PUNGR|nr:L-type lectin-domain containing receptor kinase S.4-like [Punica granatum]OWM81797.1 hypothetical protein CDL15_Pgr007835 [Punica granatum]PKI43451.1 hypothetical protein CRG98_036208 [Punica granatum]
MAALTLPRPPFSAFILLLFLLRLPYSHQQQPQTPPAPSAGGELYFPGFKNSASNISLAGFAQIQRSNGLLQLTNHTSRLLGHAFYSSPFRLKASPNGSALSFSTSFVFSIVPEYPKLGGHGLAFALSPSPHPAALPSQYLGLLNSSDMGNFSNHLFAVEFDTVQDFEFGDINDNHVGIDINSLVSNDSASAAYYAGDSSGKVDLNLKSGKPVFAWVDYDSGSTTVNVTVSPSSSKPTKPILSFKVDLSPILNEHMYVGFSASTGLLASSHYVLGWSFSIGGGGDSRALELSSLPQLPGPKKDHRVALAIGVSFSVVLVLVLAIGAVFYIVRKIRNADPIEDWELDIGPHRFSYQELKRATDGFKGNQLLGAGGFGQVYRGILRNSKTQIAVKRISHESKQGLREFVSEISTIGRLRHRNLVQLLGWCRRRSDLLLVYEFMPNGSLDKFLFDGPETTLDWDQRFNIIKGVASGLLYLHEGYEQVVIHRDVKASNVLLDGELNGRLGDFGLARLYDHGSNPSTTRVVGTLGYLAPELSRTGKSDAFSDVYAFGAFLLEVVCGRRPIEPKAPAEELVLVDWVWERYREGRVLDVVDSKLNGEFNESEVLMILKLGLMCSNSKPDQRPSMRQVMRYLDGEVEVPESSRAPGALEVERGQGGFEDFLDSFASSSFDNMSSSSFTGRRDFDTTLSLSTPRSLPNVSTGYTR